MNPAVIVMLVVASSSTAECPLAETSSRAALIRQTLDQEADHAQWWNWGWGVGLGVVAVGHVVLAENWTPIEVGPDGRRVLYVSATKAALGAVASVVMPVRIRRLSETSGGCTSLASAEDALANAADEEWSKFILGHVGGLVVTAAGTLVLGLGYGLWTEGLLSAALGYGVSLLRTYTIPRGALHVPSSAGLEPLSGSPNWTVIPAVGADAFYLQLVFQL